MPLAALYDIHGNLPALEAVLRDVRASGVDRIVIGGDVIPGPMPREALDRLLELDTPTHFIHGNGEREVLARMAGLETGNVPAPFREIIAWVAQQLDREDRDWLSGWPATLHATINGIGDVLFCHATPRNDTDVFTRKTPDAALLPIFEGVGVPLVVCGHTHMQFDREIGSVRVVNAGSVGMPFGRPGADWLLLGPGVELRHTDYDLSAAAERIRRTSYPQASEFAANDVLAPRSEQEALELYGRVELR